MNQDSFKPNTNELIQLNKEAAADFGDPDLQVAPTRQLVVVACMDSRMDIFTILGLKDGEAHIIRNAGGVITDDVIRSLCLSQRFMGTREILLMHHTDCGLQHVSEDTFKDEIEKETGVRPWWALESFSDAQADVGQSMQRLEMSPFIAHKDHIRGFVYDVHDGLIQEVKRQPG